LIGGKVWRRRESNGGPESVAENAGAIRSDLSAEESAACGDAGASENAPDGAASTDVCSSVARQGGVAVLEDAIAEIDAGRIDDARALLLAFVAAARSHVTPRTSMAFGEHETRSDR
jgi:hypothetical protein